MTAPLQHRHFDYVLGPNQDSRLTSVAAGQVIEEILLNTDGDAPFVLTGRAVRHAYTSALTQANLQGLKTRWTGPNRDYRQKTFLRESLQMAYYGQFGNPKPIVPGILYPPRSVLRLDLKNTGGSTITNLTFYWRGFKMYPEGAVPAYTYPKRLASQTFSYPIFVSQLGVSETRLNQIFTCKGDADFVLRAGQGITPLSIGTQSPRVLAEVAILLRDHQKNPYSNDYIPFDILFGVGAFPQAIPLGPTPVFVSPFGTGPGQPGLFYPEIYVPQNHQLLYDLQRSDGAGGSNQAEDFTFNFIGGKVFEK
jgi:hypothetical protein